MPATETRDATDIAHTAVPAFSSSLHTNHTPPSPRSPSDNTLSRLLWLAVGVGAAYVLYRSIPEGRRYLKLERM